MLRVTLKGLLGHKLRFALTAIAVTVGVAFVVGSIVLSESVRAQFGTLFEQINAGIDLQVRGKEKFDTGDFGGNSAAPVSADLIAPVRSVEGVANAEGAVGGIGVYVVDKNGKVVKPTGGPPLGFNWSGDPELSTVTIVEGKGPTKRDQLLMDIDTAEKAGYRVGDTVTITPPGGDTRQATYELSGLVKFGSSNALSGATLVAFTTPEAQRLFNLEGKYQTIDIRLDDGADADQVSAAISKVLPGGDEVVTRDVLVAEGKSSIGQFIDIFQNVLLGFAGVILFVAAFLISNTFRIVVGQRVRELALLRAVGAGRGQVFSSVLGEALVIGIVSSVVGFGLGILTAAGLNAIINSAGFGAGQTKLVITAPPFIAAAVIGILVTLLASIAPAWRATRVAPVEAMRDGFSPDGESTRTRAVVGVVAVLFGALLIVSSLFGSAKGISILFGMAIGAILVFLGVAGLSPTFASPVARALGLPFSALFRMPGRLARENAARSPRRTSSTASALMIGLALVCMTFVVGSSIKTSFAGTFETAIRADWYIVGDQQFVGFSPEIAQQMNKLPELSAVTPGRQGAMQVKGKAKFMTALDYAAVQDMFKLDVTSGSVGPGDHGLLIGTDPAKDLGVKAGDTLKVVFNETGTVEVPVVAVFDETSVLGNWVLDLDTYRQNFSVDQDVFIAAKTADGVAPDQARAAIEQVLKPFPQLKVQDAEQYQNSMESQLDVVLVIVNVFLFIAIAIAFIGITNTLALSVFERTRELGLLRAVGQTRGQVRAMITMEAVVVSLFGAVLGVVIGVSFGVAIASALPDDLISVVDVPAGFLLTMLVLAAALGVVAAVYPAIRASRLNVLEAITFE